jgi:uncharacterized protein YciI
MKHFILLYEYVPDMAARRDPHRPAHLAHIGAAEKRGEIVLAGPLMEPIDGALLVFNAADKGVVETFARNDPYAAAGLIPKYTVREWGPAFGAERLK